MKKFFAKLFARLSIFFTPTRIGVAVISGLFFWFMVMGDQGIIKLKRLIEMKSNLLAEREALNAEIESLSKEKALLSDPANLELTIRKELGYVRPGEVVFEERIADAKPIVSANKSPEIEGSPSNTTEVETRASKE